MSKFSQALDKIQQGRGDEKPERKRPKKTQKLSIPEQITDRPLSWDLGIRAMKDAETDNRIVTVRFPNSLITEQYRMLRTSLKARFVKEGVQAIMVSSSINGEGKSITATNLAMSLAEDEKVEVALIDADLRRGQIHDYMGFGKKLKGLSNVLSENINPKEAFLKNSRPNLSIMPRGDIPKNPSSLIGSEKFRILLAELRTHYDYIIVDAPPIMSVADPGIMAREVDGVLFIIQIGRTPKSMIAHSNLLFKQSGANMLGYVLTNVEYQSADYRYYNKYYESYEDSDRKGLKKKARFHMKRTGFGLDHAERKFTHWWQKKVAGKKES